MKILISDVDGTLRPKSEQSDTVFSITGNTIKISSPKFSPHIEMKIRRMQDDGEIYFGPCSGWDLASLERYLPFADFWIAEEGAVIKTGGQTVEPYKDTSKEYISLIESLKSKYLNLDCGFIGVLPRKYSCLAMFIAEIGNTSNEKIPIFEHQGLLLNQFESMKSVEYNGKFVKAQVQFAEYRIPEINKADGVKLIFKTFSDCSAIYFGDDKNDLPVFELTDIIKVAPSTAKSLVLEKADHVVNPPPYGIEALLKGIETEFSHIDQIKVDFSIKNTFKEWREELLKRSCSLVDRPSPAFETLFIKVVAYTSQKLSCIEYWHSLDVLNNALDIMAGEDINDINKEAVVIAALLHDISEFDSGDHHQASALAAKNLLLEFGCDNQFIELVTDMIHLHGDKDRQAVGQHLHEHNVLIDADHLSKFNFQGRTRAALFQQSNNLEKYLENNIQSIDTYINQITSKLFYPSSKAVFKKHHYALSTIMLNHVFNLATTKDWCYKKENKIFCEGGPK